MVSDHVWLLGPDCSDLGQAIEDLLPANLLSASTAAGSGCSFGTLQLPPITHPGVLYFAIAGSIHLLVLLKPLVSKLVHHSAPFKRKKETRDGDLGV